MYDILHLIKLEMAVMAFRRKARPDQLLTNDRHQNHSFVVFIRFAACGVKQV
jgi:hypothetical protein